MNVNVNAELFRIVALCQSKEETRYYLCGVYIEPHAIGVTMTATDGTMLVSIHDETGTCDAAHVVQLSKEALRACKASKKESEPRRVLIGGDNKAFVRTHTDIDMAVTQTPIVNGVFPDWRAVVTSSHHTSNDSKCKEHVPTFGHAPLRVLCDVARELGSLGFIMTGATTGGAATVRFTDAPHVFGLIMPVSNKHAPELPGELPLPDWYSAQTPLKIAA